MTLQEYQIASQRTCPSLGSIELDLSHMVLGMCSELEELSTAIQNNDYVNIGEELADGFGWYLSNYCTLRSEDYSYYFKNIDLPSYKEDNTSLLSNSYDAISKLQDLVKKFIAYKKPIPIEKEQSLLSTLATLFSDFCVINNLNLEQILQNNIKKLLIRFPDKFTENNAINRNLEAERKELEK